MFGPLARTRPRLPVRTTGKWYTAASASTSTASTSTSASAISSAEATSSSEPSTATSSVAKGAPLRRRRSDLPTSGVDLVAPPDPLSNIRPIIYASKPITRPSSNSPYSASEFPSDGSDSRLENMELEWRLRRERVDLTNHRFWATTNANFNAQLAHRLSLLPKASDPPTPEDTKRHEDCMTQFYADWQMANQERQVAWVKDWWREIWHGLKIQTRLYILRGMRR
ncbi:hypothetical protein CI109_101163 [Kwoniella shandongensis]|uniref:Uncharacterized protein n=1 Tax=Kwoniella shandongensis TaxID=1734106 RepID=A0A5M6C9Z1_9TREE|nr:uncharacterized protein CI109_001632 [Kwoniella shandongensis]KAA5530225.1 hypothetical protein CI109_001632 [Kwoniella shandongensis]